MAGTNTPVRGLYKPAVNEVGWDQLVNANFDNLDATANKSYVDSQDGAEATARANADATLTTSVSGKADKTYVDSQDTAEATARTNADTALQTNINAKQATLTGAGLARNGGACTELSGDATTAGSNVVTVAKIGGATPAAIATSGKWSDLKAATAALVINNGTNGTEFDQSSAALWKWINTTIATNGTTNASPILDLSANYWTGSASAEDAWTLQSSLAAGTNGASTLTFAHSGSTGYPLLAAPGFAPTNGNGGNLPPTSAPSGFYALGNSPLVYNGSGGLGGTYALFINSGGTNIAAFVVSGLNLPSTEGIGFSSGTVLTNRDSGFSRLGAASIGLGNGTVGDFSGSLKLTTVQMAASGGAPTSAATAGTAGQIIFFGSNMYFCSVTGAAGSATWNKLNLTPV